VRTTDASHDRERSPAGTSPAGTSPAVTSPVWRRSDIQINERIRIATFEAGPTKVTAPTIVLLHGIGEWSQMAWNPVAAGLERTHRLVAIDLPGFGESSRPDIRYDVQLFVTAVRAVIEGLFVRRFAVAGHSLGGLVAAQFAGIYPDNVGLLCLIDPAGFVRTPNLFLKILAAQSLAALYQIPPAPGFVRHLLEKSVYDPRSITPEVRAHALELARDPALRRAFARVYAGAYDDFVDAARLNQEMARYRGRTLIFWGRHDRYIPVRGMDAARRIYKDAEAMVIEECGHCPNIETPEIVIQRLSSYRDPAS